MRVGSQQMSWLILNALCPFQGFEWVNEGKTPKSPKWGFTAKQPGSKISFKVIHPQIFPSFRTCSCMHPGLAGFITLRLGPALDPC